MKETIPPIKGMYRDVVENAECVAVFDSGWVSNTIVTGCHVLLASLMKNEAITMGIQNLKVGQGLEEWDANPVPPDVGDIALADVNHFTVDTLVLRYLDENNVEQDTASSRIQIIATLEPGDPPPPLATLNSYPLREFGLFGTLDGVDYMINSVRHPVIHKDANATLIRTVRLFF